MGKIIYKPHCGKCGAIIDQEVTYKKDLEAITKNRLHSGYFTVDPYRCACCGEVFNTIEIPIPKERPGVAIGEGAAYENNN